MLPTSNQYFQTLTHHFLINKVSFINCKKLIYCLLQECKKAKLLKVVVLNSLHDTFFFLLLKGVLLIHLPQFLFFHFLCIIYVCFMQRLSWLLSYFLRLHLFLYKRYLFLLLLRLRLIRVQLLLLLRRVKLFLMRLVTLVY